MYVIQEICLISKGGGGGGIFFRSNSYKNQTQ